MLIFDQLRKDDPQLRGVALLVSLGLFVLLGGLWWVQVAMARTYQSNLETQSYRTIRIPAVRGKLLDRNGTVLAENRPVYNLSLYLEELRSAFDSEYARQVTARRDVLKRNAEGLAKNLGRSLNRAERKQFVISGKEKIEIRRSARIAVVSNLVREVSITLKEPVTFDPDDFERHYETRLALPFPILRSLTPAQIAVLQEQPRVRMGVDLEVQSTRVYPNQTLAAHVLGRLQRDDRSMDGEEAFFSYRLPDYSGLVGIESIYDRQLRGNAGSKSVLVNNVGYRQTERVWVAAEPGRDLVLTLDRQVQDAAEKGLQAVFGPYTKGAAIVMDVNNGNILALASSPTLNPNHFVQGFPKGEWARISDQRAELNRATHANYAPGSIFKTIVGLAALEAGLNPREIYNAPENPKQPGYAVFFVGGRHPVKDTAPPGPFDFKRAFKRSSNSYFINAGLRVGPDRIFEMGHRFHLGERTGLLPRQESPGYFPPSQHPAQGWTDGNTANLSIGQDPVLVTPLQIAVLTSAIANGGKVLWPRLADHFESQDSVSGEKPEYLPILPPRGEIKVSNRSLSVLQEAMLADVEETEGTGKKAAVPGLRICGKTGTAQVQDERGHKSGQITWFASYAPYEKPRWAVVVMVENGASGGDTCAPVAGKIYSALLQSERTPVTVATIGPKGGRP